MLNKLTQVRAVALIVDTIYKTLLGYIQVEF